MNSLKPSQKIRVAISNGVKTVSEYAQYRARLKNPELREIAEMQGV